MYFVLESLEGKKKNIRRRKRQGEEKEGTSSCVLTACHRATRRSGGCLCAMDEAVSAGTAVCRSWNGRELGWVVTAPLSVPCATTPRGLGVPVVLPGLPLPCWISPGPDPSVLPAGSARPRLPAVPARPGLMQTAFPGKPSRFPTGWGSRTGGRLGRGVPAAVLRTPGTGRATRRLPGALLTRRTRSGSGGVGWRLWLRCKRWG